MKCPHCMVEFHDKPFAIGIGIDKDGGWILSTVRCPACERMVFTLLNGTPYKNQRDELVNVGGIVKSFLVWPKGSSRAPCPPEVPKELADDYKEACIVLPDSPKASAALSRRCLQRLLREVAKVEPGNLADEIQQVIDSKNLPSHLVEAIDAVRNIGNFAAHPLKSEKSGEILPVEPAEGEWNLDVLEGLFDFYFVLPARTRKKREALNEKLRAAGKTPMK